MKNCPFCGSQIEDGDHFCKNCGKEINVTSNGQSDFNEDSQSPEISQENSAKKKLFVALFFIALIILGMGWWSWKSSQEGTELRTDSLATADVSNANDGIEDAKLSKFREKFTIENILALYEQPKSSSAAQKCGFKFVYKDTEREELEGGDYVEYYIIAYGFDIEKGNKRDEMGYDIKAMSNHACCFEYHRGQDDVCTLLFRDKFDFDNFFDSATRSGFTRNGEVYSNGKVRIVRDNNAKGGWFHANLEHDYYENNTDDNSSSGTMSESNKQKAIQYMSELEYIRMQIEDILNQYNRLSSSNSIDPLSFNNFKLDAFQKIENLNKQAGSIFDNLISLARETGGDVNSLQQQKKAFLGDANRIKYAIYNGE